MNRAPLLLLIVALLIGASIYAWPRDDHPQVRAGAPTPDATALVDRHEPGEVRPSDERVPDRQVATAVAGGRRLLGRVVDAFGAPAAGALVGFTDAAQPTRCDADGRFALPVTDPAAMHLELLILHDGHAPGVWTEPLAAAASDEVDLGELELPRGGALRGRAVDPAGRPLAAATVSLTVRDVPGWQTSFALGDLLAPVASADDGSFVFTDLAGGDYRVEIDAPGHQRARSATVSVRAGAELAIGDLILATGHTLRGIVRDARSAAPLVDAELTLRNGSGQGYYRGSCRSAADGSFAIDALPAGPLRMQISRQGYLATELDAVDPVAGTALEIELTPGLRIEVQVVDAGSGAAIEPFATIARRIGNLDPDSNGTMAQQLDRHLAELRPQLAEAAGDAAEQRRLQQIIEALQRRRRHVELVDDDRPAARPPQLPEASHHPGGETELSGLDEGMYMVGIAAPTHRYTELGPVELRLGAAPPQLRFLLERGPRVHGMVVDGAGSPVAGVQVELVELLAGPDAGTPAETPLYPWVFAPPRPAGITVQQVRTGGDGRFEFAQAAAHRSYLSVRGPKISDHDSALFTPTIDAPPRVITVAARALLRGRVLDAAAAGTAVLALGGHGEQRVVSAGRDGSYEFRDLQPGGYLLRAYPSDDDRFVQRLFAELFPQTAGAVDESRLPRLDVELRAGEQRVHDLRFTPTAMGHVEGVIRVNGAPANRARVVLRPVAGGLPVRGSCDRDGRFTIEAAPATGYRAQVYSADQQPLHEAELTVIEATGTRLDLDLSAGALRGLVLAPDLADATALSGRVWLLPGADQAPADPYVWRRDHRAHRLSIRAGAFQSETLTPGPAVVLIDVRGRPRAVAGVDIPPAGTANLSVTLEPPRL